MARPMTMATTDTTEGNDTGADFTVSEFPE